MPVLRCHALKGQIDRCSISVSCDDLWLQIKIAVSSVTDIIKMNTVMIIPNAVGIFTAADKVRACSAVNQTYHSASLAVQMSVSVCLSVTGHFVDEYS